MCQGDALALLCQGCAIVSQCVSNSSEITIRVEPRCQRHPKLFCTYIQPEDVLNCLCFSTVIVCVERLIRVQDQFQRNLFSCLLFPGGALYANLTLS